LKQRLVPLAFAACCVPALWLVVQFFTVGFGADPIAVLLNDLGYITFVLLALTLACTPAQIVLGWKWPIRIRKTLGDFCFFYGSCHLLTYLGLDQGFSLDDIVKDVLKHKFIFLGMATSGSASAAGSACTAWSTWREARPASTFSCVSRHRGWKPLRGWR